MTTPATVIPTEEEIAAAIANAQKDFSGATRTSPYLAREALNPGQHSGNQAGGAGVVNFIGPSAYESIGRLKLER